MRVYIVSMYNIDAANFDGYSAEIMAVCASQELADKAVERLRKVFPRGRFDIDDYELEEV